MPSLDSCINATFEPGNIGSSIGTTPIVIRPGTLYTPDDYPVETVQWSMVYSRFYDSAYVGAF
jgi:hypothetical protein